MDQSSAIEEQWLTAAKKLLSVGLQSQKIYLYLSIPIELPSRTVAWCR